MNGTINGMIDSRVAQSVGGPLCPAPFTVVHTLVRYLFTSPCYHHGEGAIATKALLPLRLL
jgi:hypothetical protein